MAKRSDPRMLKPYEMIARRSDKGFNTTTVKVRPKVGARCCKQPKDTVNTARINAELFRLRIQRASFVAAPLLRRKDNTLIASLK